MGDFGSNPRPFQPPLSDGNLSGTLPLCLVNKEVGGSPSELCHSVYFGNAGQALTTPNIEGNSDEHNRNACKEVKILKRRKHQYFLKETLHLITVN